MRVRLRPGLRQAGGEHRDRVVEEAGARVVVRRLEGVGVLVERLQGRGLGRVGGRVGGRAGSRVARQPALAGGERVERVHGERRGGLGEGVLDAPGVAQQGGRQRQRGGVARGLARERAVEEVERAGGVPARRLEPRLLERGGRR